MSRGAANGGPHISSRDNPSTSGFGREPVQEFIMRWTRRPGPGAAPCPSPPGRLGSIGGAWISGAASHPFALGSRSDAPEPTVSRHPSTPTPPTIGGTSKPPFVDVNDLQPASAAWDSMAAATRSPGSKQVSGRWSGCSSRCRSVRCACAGTLGFVCFGALLDRPEHFSFHDQVDRVEQEKGRVGVSQWGRRSPRTRMRSRHVGGTPTVHLVALY